MKAEFTPGQTVTVIVRVHAKGARFEEKPPLEKQGVFIRYGNKGKAAIVRIRTIEGEQERSFRLEAVKA